MSSHPNRVPAIEVWKYTDNPPVWTWDCNDHLECDNYYGVRRDYPTHAEAIAAADAHCKEASK